MVQEQLQKGKPFEIKALVAIEAFAGINYLLYLSGFMVSINAFLLLPLAMAAISFFIAYGLWKLLKVAWYLSFLFSIVGLSLGLIVVLMTGFTETNMLQNVPRLLLDALTIFLLTRADVRKIFRI
uniref:Uncharacterized protein n=1 Tax=Candidatus Methanomethylicus mesodigestus TaxID=1867258 RepID=A0A7C3J510_9CREN